jgi:Flp pilus assembly protein TadG
MRCRSHFDCWLKGMSCRLRADESASQIAEFALSLPLLVVFVVGIFDFSGALALKQKLTNAAREGARVAAADPATDLVGGVTPVPVSVIDAFYVVDNYLKSENLNDCGLGTTPPTLSGTLTWSVTQNSTGCPGNGIVFTINRGYYFPQTGATAPTSACTPQPTQTAVIGTCVSIQYGYKWRFNSVITLLVPSATYASVSNITTTATAFNEN